MFFQIKSVMFKLSRRELHIPAKRKSADLYVINPRKFICQTAQLYLLLFVTCSLLG